ncbi:MAG TPA: TatD family hydrolase [Microbacteriaceae bacterium]|jgi:TatD DNase family protein|nr:TatD family hydrolase [Microbacteriaceae bacterium]
MLPPIDAHAHINVRAHPLDLLELDAVVLAVTRSIDEWRPTTSRGDELALWGVGCHPGVTEAVDAFHVEEFDEALQKAAFVGEVGLDGRSPVPMDKQLEVLTAVLDCVQRTPRPVSIHSTRATRLILDALEDQPIHGAILHWWRGSEKETSRAVELGCFFSFNGHEARSPKTIALVPPSLILTETDFPHSTRYDAKADRPAAMQTIEQALLAEHALSGVDELREILWTNLRSVFRGAELAIPATCRVGELLFR